MKCENLPLKIIGKFNKKYRENKLISNHSLYKPKTIVKLFYLWLSYFLKNIFRKKRFVAITPAFFKLQYIFDRMRRRYFKIAVRDGVDWTQLEHIFLCSEYSLETSSRNADFLKLYAHLQKNGENPLIVDCGANIGLASKYFAITYPAAKIIAVEPDAANMAQARKNNQGEDVIFLEAAISSEMGKGSLIDMGSSNAFRVCKDSNGGLDFISINQILEENKNFVPFILKVDIEGFEEDLFSKNIEWIDKFPVIFIELHDWMIPKAGISRNFLKAISIRERDFMHFPGYVLSISNNF